MKLFKRILIATTIVAGAAGPALAAHQPGGPEAELTTGLAPAEQQQMGEAARARAEEYRQLAQRYRDMGGVAYKLGLVREAEWRAARYEAAEQAWLARGEQPRVLSPEAERYTRLAQQYREMGGGAYKTGLVAWAEAQARRHGAPQPGWQGVGVGIRPPAWWKPWLNQTM